MRQIQMMPIGDVHPYPDNPRKNDDAVDAVATSLKEYGWQQPIVVDKDNVIIVGHTRREAAKKLGMKEVPVIVADNLTEAQVKAYRLADNKTGELSDWDFDLLSQELEALKDMDYDISLAGFDDTDIHLPTDEAVDDNFDEEPPEDPITEPGDIWLLGRHRLMCGDSTQPDDIETLMGGVQADLYLTDPPYNVDYTGKTADKLKIENDSMEGDAFTEFLDEAFTAAKNVLKGGAAIYICHAGVQGYYFIKACMDVGWEVRQCLIWEKNSMVIGRQDYQWIHEPILYLWNNGGSHAWYGDRKQTTVLHFDRPTKAKYHPTMKPIPLFDYLIQNSSKAGDIVLDSFGGSGTTLMACEQDGRTGYVNEIDPRYCDVILDRFAAFKGSTEDIYLLKPDGSKVPYETLKR